MTWRGLPPQPICGVSNVCNAPPHAFTADTQLPTGVEPVGSFPAGNSPYGVKDMAGNAREWVAWTPSQDPQDVSTAPARGGSFKPPASACATDHSQILQRLRRDNATGFRGAMDTPDLEP